MTFDDLQFTNEGCCGTHVWADAIHENGVRTQVFRRTEGGFEAATWCGNVLYRAASPLADEASVSARLADDAALSI